MAKFVDWQPRAREELREWKQENPLIAKRIYELLRDIQIRPFTGIGKPEALKHDLSGWWSRRINLANRLIYTVTDDAIIIMSCKYHYKKKNK